MNKIGRKLTAAGLCAALCLTGAGAAFAQTTGKTEDKRSKTSESAQTTPTEASSEASKDETVYVLAGANGSVQKIIVSDWIKNALGSDTVSDKTDLSNIENVKGDESYSLNGSNMTVWDAQGNDIYYQGNIEKELPVDLSICYKLDGKAVSAEEIAGKSGKVTIRFDYRNNQYEMVEIDGEKEKIYVPFAMLTGMMLDSDAFRNVEVSNGKLLNDGDRTIVVGLAFPGLQENLGLSRETLEIPNYVEITADVTDFELGMTVTVAANEVFNEIDVDHIGLSDVDGSLRELTDAMAQLMDGSSVLYDGLCTLLEKSNELVAGVKELAEGANALKAGADALGTGADKLLTGAEKLSAGLDNLSSNSASLNSGAAQVFNSLLSAAATQIRAAGISVSDMTISNYAEVLNGVIATLDETAVYDQALQQVTAAVEAKRPEITEKVTAAVRTQVTQQVTETVQSQVSASVTAAVEEQVTQQVLQAMGLTNAGYEAGIAAGQISRQEQARIEAAIATQMASEEIQSRIASTVSEKMASSEIQATIGGNVEARMQSETVQNTIAQNGEAQVRQAISENMQSDAVQSQLAEASEGSKTIIALKTSLDSYNAFYLGVLSYTGGVDSVASGAGELSDGVSDLKDGTATLKVGAAKLYSGVLTLQDGMPALIGGITELRDGAMALSDGLEQFNEEGIQKLVNLIDEDLDGVAVRLKATVDASKRYTNFSGISDGMDGQVKFIYRTDEIKAN